MQSVSMRSQSLPRDAKPPDTPLSPELEPELQLQVVEPEPEPEREPEPEHENAKRDGEDEMDAGEETTTPTTTTNLVAPGEAGEEDDGEVSSAKKDLNLASDAFNNG
ncbi:hypothetical protein H0H92_005944 [Tricholoma furcatifolium]|nr:hypothetical protein H0H92_005944 [Tricholoma furcatifolium]